MTLSHLMNRLRQDVQGAIRETVSDADFVLCFDVGFEPFLISKAKLVALPPPFVPQARPPVKAKKKGK